MEGGREEEQDYRQTGGGIMHQYSHCYLLFLIFLIKLLLMEICPCTPQLFAEGIHPALFSFAVEVVANAFPIYQFDRHSVLVCFTQQGKLITHLL